MFWWKGHGSPPKQLDQWYDLVRATVDHWIQRYGLQEVRTWYFECWNEVSLPGGTIWITLGRKAKLTVVTAELERFFQGQQVSVLCSVRVHCQGS